MTVWVRILGLLVMAGLIVGVYQIPYSICNNPLPYKIGAIDAEFDINSEEILADVKAAADIWGKVYGKQLFSYSPSAKGLTINFVYDKRTAIDEKVDIMQNQLNRKNVTLESETKKFETAVNNFEKRLTDFNARVKKYNNQGGAPQDIYDQLTGEQRSLKIEAEELEAKAERLDLAALNYNFQVDNFNSEVTKFNQALVEKPEEGLYDGLRKTITIYFANNRPEIIHTLAHEFGHALGMDHTYSPSSIMYPYTSKSLTVTAEDREEIDKACQEIPLPIYISGWLREKLTEVTRYEYEQK